MNYAEMIAKALKGRSVTSMAKAWGVPQATLDRYVKGERLPDFDTALKMANEAGIAPGEAFETLAAEQRMHKSRQFRLQSGRVHTDLLLAIATCGASTLIVYIMSN